MSFKITEKSFSTARDKLFDQSNIRYSIIETFDT
jgi:hypothetical protein